MSKAIQDISTALQDLVASVAESVVSIRSERMQSSGFAWRPGLIATSDEGLAEDGEISVALPGGDEIPAHVAGRDPSTALALLKCQRTDLSPVAMAAVLPRVGALVLAVGAADGYPTAALGMVSMSRGPWQSMRGGDIDARVEIDARVPRRAEGGLAVDAAGQPFGMLVFGPRHRVLVIPAATISRVTAKLETHGRIPRGYLGLGLQPVTVEGGGAGIMVMSVDPKGPGAAADLHQGDVLVSWDGNPVGTLQALLKALGGDSVGKTLVFEVRRGGQIHRAKLQIGERPAA